MSLWTSAAADSAAPAHSDAEVSKVRELIGVFDMVQEEHDKIWEDYSSDIDGQVA